MDQQEKGATTDDTEPRITRRRVLQGAAAAGAVGVVGGEAAGQPEAERHIVGTEANQQAVDAVRQHADSVYKELDFGSIGRAVAGQFAPQAREALEQRADVRYIEADGTYEAIAQDLPWGVDRIDADEIHAEGRTGDGADIAIIDTGIDSNHEDLVGNLGAGHAVVNCDPDNTCSGCECNEPWDDDNSHGTHVAGTADAVDNDSGVIGVSTEATLHAVKVLNAFGSGSWSDIADGIVEVADAGYGVGNMSLGGYNYSHTVSDACLYAWDNGVLLVAAAGNEDQSSDSVLYPAKFSTVIAVSATNENDELASFSSKGPEVELAAPGANINSTLPGDNYGTANGTSMASPHIAGTGGQLTALDYPNRRARDQLRSTAENLGLSDNEQGWGLVDAQAAVPGPIGEVGTVTGNSSWQTVNLQQSYDDLTVIMTPPSYNGGHQGHIRLRNVGGSSFEFRFEEWDYLDGWHTDETMHYVAIERGVHTLPDGSVMVAGYLGGFNHNWSEALYGHTFDETPVVISQPQSFNGSDAIVSRQRNIQTDRVEWRVQEEEAAGWHTDERIGAIIMEPGARSLYGVDFEIARTSDLVNHNWYQIGFEQSYDGPQFLTDMQTFNGADPCGLRYRNLTTDGAEVFVEEEQSADDETSHWNAESVGYLVIATAVEPFDDDTGAILGTTTSGSEGLSYTGDVSTE